MEEKVTAHLVQIVLGAFGGAAKYMHEYIQGYPFSWPKLGANVLVAAFAGWVSWRVALLFWPPAATIVTAVGGYMGGRAMELLSEIAISRAKKRSEGGE